jgi:hypothetical protein
MKPSPENNDRLEHFIHRIVRDLPARQAPQSLQLRVLAAIEQRAMLPWWRKIFAYWPLPARAAFLLLSAGLVTAVVWLVAGFDVAPARDSIAAQFGWVKGLSTIATRAVDFIQIVINAIPPLWLYGGLAVVAAAYAVLFGLGAAAYRTLFASP